MADTVSAFIQGNPVAQGRGRIVRVGQHARIADPAKSRDWKGYAKMCLAAAAPPEPADCPVMMAVTFVFERPKSRKRDNWVSVKPDLDNLVKGIQDAGNGILYRDDRQIAYLVAQKCYVCPKEPRPGVRVEMRKLF